MPLDAQRNGVESRLRIVSGAADLERGSDVLLANILAGTLIELAAELCSLLRPGGRYVLTVLPAGGGHVTARSIAVRQEPMELDLDLTDGAGG